MRRAARIDANQPAIVADLRRAGASVVSLAAIGKGCPDLAVGFRGRTYLFEVKDPVQPPSGRKLTPDEQRFFETWKGHYSVIHTFAEAWEVISQ